MFRYLHPRFIYHTFGIVRCVEIQDNICYKRPGWKILKENEIETTNSIEFIEGYFNWDVEHINCQKQENADIPEDFNERIWKDHSELRR